MHIEHLADLFRIVPQIQRASMEATTEEEARKVRVDAAILLAFADTLARPGTRDALMLMTSTIPNKPNAATTGRMSCSEPNISNGPKTAAPVATKSKSKRKSKPPKEEVVVIDEDGDATAPREVIVTPSEYWSCKLCFHTFHVRDADRTNKDRLGCPKCKHIGLDPSTKPEPLKINSPDFVPAPPIIRAPVPPTPPVVSAAEPKPEEEAPVVSAAEPKPEEEAPEEEKPKSPPINSKTGKPLSRKRIPKSESKAKKSKKTAQTVPESQKDPPQPDLPFDPPVESEDKPTHDEMIDALQDELDQAEQTLKETAEEHDISLPESDDKVDSQMEVISAPEVPTIEVPEAPAQPSLEEKLKATVEKHRKKRKNAATNVETETQEEKPVVKKRSRKKVAPKKGKQYEQPIENDLESIPQDDEADKMVDELLSQSSATMDIGINTDTAAKEFEEMIGAWEENKVITEWERVTGKKHDKQTTDKMVKQIAQAYVGNTIAAG